MERSFAKIVNVGIYLLKVNTLDTLERGVNIFHTLVFLLSTLNM